MNVVSNYYSALCTTKSASMQSEVCPRSITDEYRGTLCAALKQHVLMIPILSEAIFLVLVFLAAFSAMRLSRHPSIDILTKFRFIWHNFISPIGSLEHKDRIETFYRGQADIYDETRSNLLKGRRTLLRLSAAHLRGILQNGQGRRMVWIDVGGGTGFNIEAMDEFLPITSFDAVYLVDICKPLLEIARQRFASQGWTNVHILHQDAASFVLPEVECAGQQMEGSASFVTLSYSLSMIPNFYAVLDRVSTLLSPDDGLLSVVDFYTSSVTDQQNSSVVDVNRTCGWLSRWFWQIWFDFDHVALGPARREYLEHKFETLKVLNERNHFLLPLIVRIPYFVWLGQARNSKVTKEKACISAGTMIRRLPANGFCNSPWRIPYDTKPVHDTMTTFMYSFTWEDPFEDMKYLDLGASESLLVVTSAGDNVLHYALEGNFQSLHCVDMNPCQGHLAELKLAALKTLPYDTFFEMFGRGHIDSFQDILDLRLSPLLSAPCYQFWTTNANMFAPSSTLYMHGFSGYALCFVRALFRVTGRLGDVQRMCNASTMAEQERIWNERIRPVLLHPLSVLLIDNAWVCWRALGVPENQRNMLLQEGTMPEYVKDTLDPVATSGLFQDGAYHYLLTLLGNYTPDSCPLYLTRDGFEALQVDGDKLMNRINIHTDTISEVLKMMEPASLSRCVLMDHMDWFSKESPEFAEEIDLLHRALKPGGFILLRSAARTPWYIERFASSGFEATCISVRKPGSNVALDRVNMYASFWKIKKKDEEFL